MTLIQLTHELTGTFLLSVGAFILAMVLTPVYTFIAYRYKFWGKQRVTSSSGETPTIIPQLTTDKLRRNIPTMAGVIGVVAITMVTIFFNFDRAQTWLPLAALIGGGAVGLLDDVINIRGQGMGVTGLRSGLRLLMITILALFLGWFFFVKLGYNGIHLPYLGNFTLGWVIVPLFVLAVIATGKAVNISDEFDGLAGGLLAISFGTFGVIALLQGHVLVSGFCFTVVGALLSYLWFNIYPARFYMGDVGSYAFGMSLGVVAMMTDTLFLLPIIGSIFAIEAGSIALQSLSKRIFNRKIFISVPIHYHLVAQGWPETKVTMRFWVIAYVSGFLGILLALAGGYV